MNKTMVRIIILFVVILLHPVLHGQTTARHVLDDRIDSLQRLITKAAPDTARVDLYLELITGYMDRFKLRGRHSGDSIAIIETIAACSSLSNKLNYLYGIGSCLLKETRMYGAFRNLPERDEKLKQTLAFFTTAQHKKGLAEAYIAKSDYQYHADKPLRIRLYDTAYRLAKESGDVRLEAQALKTVADMHFQQAEYPLAIQQLQTVYDLQKRSGDNRIHNTTDLMAALYYRTGKYKEGLESALASIDYSRKVSDTVNIPTFYQRLGMIYFAMNDLEKAYDNMNRAFSGTTHTANSRSQTITLLSNMSFCLSQQGKHQEALDFFSREIKKYPPLDSVSNHQADNTYLNLYYMLKQYKDAEIYFVKAVRFLSVAGSGLSKMYLFTRGANIYQELKQYDKAYMYADSAYAMARKANSWPDLMNNAQTLHQLEVIKGNYPAALKYYKEYKTYSDSIHQEKLDKHASELAVQYETDQKNRELSFLNTKAALQQETIQQGKTLRNFMIAGSVMLLLLLLLIFNRYRVKQKANKLLQEKQDEINRQNQTLEKMVYEEKKITAEKDKLLQEKEWLMKEINHRVKNNLQVVMSLLNTQSIYLKDEVALNAIHESRHRVHAISLIHRKLYQSDQQLTTIDMSVYIKEVTEYLADSLDTQNNIKFGFFIDPIELDVSQAVPTGLIINEAVTNAVKYAFPKGRTGQINVSMYKKVSGPIELTIQDNGIGLPTGFNWHQTESLGMSLMQGLSKQLDGRFDILQEDGLSVKITFEPAKALNQ